MKVINIIAIACAVSGLSMTGMHLVKYTGGSNHHVKNVLLTKHLCTKKDNVSYDANKVTYNISSSIDTLRNKKDDLEKELLIQRLSDPYNALAKDDSTKLLESTVESIKEAVTVLEITKVRLDEKVKMNRYRSVALGTFAGAGAAGLTSFKPFMVGMVAGGGVTAVGAIALFVAIGIDMASKR